MSRPRHNSNPHKEKPEEVWIPKTRLGMLVSSGKITSLSEITANAWTIKEPEIINALIPNIRNIVVNVRIVQKQTDAGESTRFSAIVAVGDGESAFGIGNGKARHMRDSIDKAVDDAMLHVIPVKSGCGSWECKCGDSHSIPYKTVGRGGSVRVELIPGPKGLGLVAGKNIRSLLSLAGIKDVWTRTYGSTSTPASVANAVYDSLEKMHRLGDRTQ